MHVIGGFTSAAPAPGSIAGDDYPLVVRGDAVLSRLLYLRERWGLQLDGAELSRVDDFITHEAYIAPREREWLREWRHAWSCLDSAHLALSERRQPETVPPVLHAQWFTVDSNDGDVPGYASADYREWLASHPGASAKGGHISDPVTAQAAFAAAKMGLVAIFVLPLRETWFVRTRHLLGVSPVVFESDTHLRSALSGLA